MGAGVAIAGATMHTIYKTRARQNVIKTTSNYSNFLTNKANLIISSFIKKMEFLVGKYELLMANN